MAATDFTDHLVFTLSCRTTGKIQHQKSIYAFLAFGISSIFAVKAKMVMCGYILIACIVIHKHYSSAITHE